MTTALGGLTAYPALGQSTTTYTYDAQGRLLTVAHPNGKTTTYTYDAADNRQRVVVSTGGGGGGAPSAQPDSRSTAYNTPITFDPRTNDTGTAPLSVTGVGSAPNGTTSFTSSSVTYTPASGFSGTNNFTYTINNSVGPPSSSTITVTVGSPPANQPPTANPDSASTAFNTPVTISPLGNDTDPENNPLTIIGASATNGSVTFNSSTVTFTPTSGFSGTGSVSYTISDGQGNTATGAITITVSPPSGPQAVNDGLTAPYQSFQDMLFNWHTFVVSACVAVLANDSDPGGNLPLSIQSFTQPVFDPRGSVSQSGNSLCYTYSSDAPGVPVGENFSYTMRNSLGVTATATVFITFVPQ